MNDSRSTTKAPPAVPHEIETSIGGHGPESIPPGRTGGGDDWESRPPGSRGPRERIKLFRWCIGVTVVAIFALFIMVTIAAVSRKNNPATDPETGQIINDWKHIAIPPILWLNTLLLAASSFTLENARRRLFHESDVMREWLGLEPATRRASLPWLGISIVLGLGFFAGQWAAWNQLQTEGIFVSTNPSATFFYILTIGHALHLFGGMLGLIWCAVSSAVGARLPVRQVMVDATTWYWHAMGVLWIYVFAVMLILG